MLERLRNNIGLKILALAVAVAGWAYVKFTPNPVIAAHFVQQLSVPITTTGLRPDTVARFIEKQAVVGVDVPRNGPAIRPDELRAVLDLQGRDVGVYNVPVQVIAPKLEIRSLTPASVTLSIERIETRSLPVSVRYVGASQRNIVVDHLTIDPSYVVLRAPSSDLARVASVRVELPLPSAPSSFDSMVRAVATDESGAELGSVAVTPNLVRLRAHFGVGRTGGR